MTPFLDVLARYVPLLATVAGVVVLLTGLNWFLRRRWKDDPDAQFRFQFTNNRPSVWGKWTTTTSATPNPYLGMVDLSPLHAGEVDGPASVWSAIRDLGATRIGHGIHALEDPALVEFLVEKRIGLEIAITSNIQVGIVADYADHPVKKILESGIVANLNTDDPAISGIDLRHEFDVAAPRAGLTPAHIRQAQLNALEMAFLPADEKRALQARKRAAGS